MAKSNPSSTRSHKLAGRKLVQVWFDPLDWDNLARAADADQRPISQYLHRAGLAAAKKSTKSATTT